MAICTWLHDKFIFGDNFSNIEQIIMSPSLINNLISKNKTILPWGIGEKWKNSTEINLFDKSKLGKLPPSAS